MAEKKTTRRKTTRKAAKSTSAVSVSAVSAASKGLISSLASGWKEVSRKQIDFAQENTNEYFKTLRDMADAKNPQQSMMIYGRFAAGAVRRQAEQARAIGKVVSGVQKDIAGKIAKIRPSSQGK